MIVSSDWQTVESKCDELLLKQELEELVISFVDHLLWYRYLPDVRLFELGEGFLEIFFKWVDLVTIAATADEDLLEDGHDMWVIACLCCQRVYDGRYVNLTCRVHLLIEVGGNMLAALLKESHIR